MSSRILIIGAGLAGLAAANALKNLGFYPKLADKSRGIGGRLSTRRTDIGPFNHGAPSVAAQGDAFKDFLTEIDTADWNPFGYAEGVPSMSALAAPLGGDVPVQLHNGVNHVSADKQGVSVTFADGANDTYDHVIVTVPAPQAIQILSVEGVLPNWAGPLRDIQMAPCWTGLFAFDEPLQLLSVPNGVHLQKNQPNTQLSTDDEKKCEKNPERWVFNADAEWSKANLETGKDEILPALIKLFFQTINIDDMPTTFAQAHRWRYARATHSLNLPLLTAPGGRICIIGDGFSGSDGTWRDAEAAYQSGLAAAHYLSNTLS